MTGFDIVSRRLWLIALPVLLDLFLWLGPRLSAAPLLRGLIAFLRTQPAPDSTTARQIMEATSYLEQVGTHVNMLALLSRLPLLNVPSLLAWRMPASPLGEPQEVLITGLLSLASWGILLIPAGLVLGFLYLNGLARHIRSMRPSDEQKPAADEAEGAEQAAVERGSAWRFIRVLLFAAGLLAAGMISTPLWLLVVGIVETLIPGIGFWLLVFSMGMAGYMGLHLLFVIPGVIVGGRGLWQATWESIGLMHTQLFSVMGLILLAAVIHGGLSYVWLLPSTNSWALLVGIVGNGCITTGLTAAGFVFYQERIRQLTAAIQATAKTQME